MTAPTEDDRRTPKHKDRSSIVFPLRKRTSCFNGLIFLLVVSLGAGGLVLCVRKDGQSRLNNAFNRCHECNTTSSGGLMNCASSSQESGSVSGGSCEKQASCFKVPIVLIASARTSLRILSSLPADPSPPCPLFQPVPFLALYAQTYSAISQSVDPYHPSFESLRSTVLII